MSKGTGDFFGICAGAIGAVNVYFIASRATGRTTSMINSLKTGDRVVCIDDRQARYLANEIKFRNITDVDVVVIPPRDPARLYEKNTPQGRLIFDHAWIEEFIKISLNRASDEMAELQDRFGGYGEAHIETKRKAIELAKWGGLTND